MSFLREAREWLELHHRNIFVLSGVLVVGALAFESGFLRGQLAQSEPLIISIPSVAESQNNEKTQTVAENPSANTEQKNAPATEPQRTGQCPFVGSRNSNKYHLATCAVAKRIKPENKVCFASKEDAEKRGYVASCIK
jgi:hypothetical protein